MEKIIKVTALVLSVLIILSSVALLVGANADKKAGGVDFFGYKDIVKNIENLEINQTSIIYVKNEKGDWEEYQRLHGEENRIWVGLDKIPQTLIDAFVSIEDERYYSHVGVDWKRTTSAFLNQFLGFYSSNQGGSTITQQLIKNITKDKEQNATRKAREIVRALLLEKALSKEQILEAYLNTISLGNGICGVQVAANYYFNKDVSELSLVECAAIAAITKNPSAYNPEDKPEGNRERRVTVLKKMYECEKISYEEYYNTALEDIVVDDSQRKELEAPINSYFVDTVIDNVIEDLSEKYSCSKETASSMLYNGGYKIYSTVDLSIQSKMEEVYNETNRYFSQKSYKTGEKVQSAMTIMDYKGHIVGIVGGVGEKTVNRGLNRAMHSPRQPGSTMKPLGAYAPAIDKGITTYSSVYEDSPLEKYYPDGKDGPREWYGYYAGNMSVSKALERSANTIPCKIVKELGVKESFKFLTEKLNFKYLTEADKNLASLAIGGCSYGITTTESAAAYAIFGNGGKYYNPVTYYKIVGPNNEIVLQDGRNNQAIKPGTATVMNNLLQKVVYGWSGTGRGIASYSKMKAYAKTGTSSESNDLWMVAGTPYYVGSVWYGFDTPQTVWNQAAAATVWRTVMKEVHKDLEIKEFEFSDDIVEKEYCHYTGKIAGKKCYWKEKGIYVEGIKLETCDGIHKTESSSSSSGSSSSSKPVSSSKPSSSESSTPSEPDDSTTTTPSNPSEDTSTPSQTPDGDGGDTSSDGSSSETLSANQ